MKHLADQAKRLLKLADRDVKAFHVLKVAPDIDLSTVCFHAQQAVEKFLKAALVFHDVDPTRTHDLNMLVYKLQKKGIELPLSVEEISMLNPYAVVFRYDDMEIEILSREKAEEIVNAICKWAENIILK